MKVSNRSVLNFGTWPKQLLSYPRETLGATWSLVVKRKWKPIFSRWNSTTLIRSPFTVWWWNPQFLMTLVRSTPSLKQSTETLKVQLVHLNLLRELFDLRKKRFRLPQESQNIGHTGCKPRDLEIHYHDEISQNSWSAETKLQQILRYILAFEFLEQFGEEIFPCNEFREYRKIRKILQSKK